MSEKELKGRIGEIINKLTEDSLKLFTDAINDIDELVSELTEE